MRCRSVLVRGLPWLLAAGIAWSAPQSPPQSTEAAEAAPKQKSNFLASVKQAFKQDFEHAVVRGYFEVGAAPDAHRYYCLVDERTGQRQPNGVAGETFVRKDGMTGIKGAAVSLYNCAEAEQQGTLMRSDYVVKGAAATVVAPVVPAPSVAAAPLRKMPAAAAPRSVVEKIDVAGVRLGMVPDEVRMVLHGKRLLSYLEASQSLPVGSGDSVRYLASLAAWSGTAAEGESFEVMFTPEPGHERVMAIVHTRAYSTMAPRLSSLMTGLESKYGVIGAAAATPGTASWRQQADGGIEAGEGGCHRRSVLGGLAPVYSGATPRANLALNTSLEDLRLQSEQCGVALVSADYAVANPDASIGERLIARFTVSAYAPSLGLQGAAAASQMFNGKGTAVPAISPAAAVLPL